MEVLDESSATTWRVVNVIKEVRKIIGQVFHKNFPYYLFYIVIRIFFQECSKSGHPIDEAIICLTLKHVYENPKNGFDADVPMNRHAGGSQVKMEAYFLPITII